MILIQDLIDEFVFETLFWQLIAKYAVHVDEHPNNRHVLLYSAIYFFYSKWNICMLNLFYSKVWCLKLKIYNPSKQYYFPNECPIVKSVNKKEVKVHFTHEDTFHRGHPLHCVTFNCICGCLYLQLNWDRCDLQNI
jgi:hypothetical protein